MQLILGDLNPFCFGSSGGKADVRKLEKKNADLRLERVLEQP